MALSWQRVSTAVGEQEMGRAGGALLHSLLQVDQLRLAAVQGMESKRNKQSEMTALISSRKLKEIQSVNQPLMKMRSNSHQSGGCRIQQFSFQLSSNGK